MSSEMIKRHTKVGIFIHWFNAVCWFFLLFSGVGLIENPSLQPMGQWYPQMLRSLFGSGAGLLAWHWGVGLIWAGVWLLYVLVFSFKFVVPFLIDIFTMSPKRDIQWMVKKNFQMTLGYKNMAKLAAKLGWDARIPEQGYYNAGQKVAAQVIVLGGVALAATGVVMTMSKYFLEPSLVWLVQWSILIHYLAAGATLGLLLVHIYMAAISPDERPAFFSMFTGVVPAGYARHHHKLWYDKINSESHPGRTGDVVSLELKTAARRPLGPKQEVG